jgi:hypothetical protein
MPIADRVFINGLLHHCLITIARRLYLLHALWAPSKSFAISTLMLKI